MDTTSLLAAAIGFAPPISLMLWTLQKYTYPRVERPYFSDPTLFGLFAVGIVLGVILHVVSILLPLEYAITGFLIEEAIKLMILTCPGSSAGPTSRSTPSASARAWRQP
jgi:hypothetical protein